MKRFFAWVQHVLGFDDEPNPVTAKEHHSIADFDNLKEQALCVAYDALTEPVAEALHVGELVRPKDVFCHAGTEAITGVIIEVIEPFRDENTGLMNDVVVGYFYNGYFRTGFDVSRTLRKI